jgi:hypothetical protein
MADRTIAPDIFAKWLSVPESLAKIETAFGSEDVAKHLIVQRLLSAKLTSGAESSTCDNSYGRSTTKEIVIPAEDWKFFASSAAFWSSGDLYLDFGYRNTSYQKTIVWYHAVRLEPNGVEALLATAPTKLIPAKTEQAGEPEQKGKPVTDPNLALWAALYNSVYGGTTTDTLDFAWKSAQGMFPDKSVARDRVRPLVGSGTRKRGPKGPAE